MSERMAQWPIARFLRDWIGRFIAVQGIDRGMALGAYAFSALIPLLIVYSSILPDGESFADKLIDRLELKGAAAESLHRAFAPAGAVQSSVTVLGLFLLLVSALSFARGMQRLYELSYGLPSLGMRNTKWALVWLLAVCLAASARPVLANTPVLSLTESAFGWLLTPYLLLGRRLHWRKLAPTAALSVIGMTGVGIWSVIWLPHTISASASQYGIIGIAFALLTWLFATACVLVVAATGGALISERLAQRVVTPA
jgi:membrane protein